MLKFLIESIFNIQGERKYLASTRKDFDPYYLFPFFLLLLLLLPAFRVNTSTSLVETTGLTPAPATTGSLFCFLISGERAARSFRSVSSLDVSIAASDEDDFPPAAPMPSSPSTNLSASNCD